MKRFFVLAALVLGLAACQTEPEGLDVNVGGEVDTTITVSLPDTETRANSALGAFENVDWNQYTIRYQMEIYDANGRKSDAIYEQYLDGNEGRSVVFHVQLVPGRHYNFVVWADIVTDAEKTDLHYDTANLNAVSVITTDNQWKAMDETRDAFTGYFNTQKIDSNKPYNGKMSINIPLTRPFAKLRVVTTDMVELDHLDIEPHNAVATYTTAHYSTFNACDATYSGELTNVSHEYVIASYNETGANKTIFTDYFFANNEVVKFNLDVKEENGETIKANTFSTDIYVRRNFLTTIQGNILTDGNNVTVNVEDAFENVDNSGNTTDPNYDYETISSDKEFRNALKTPGKYIVISNLHIANAGDTITTLATRAGGATTIDLNGKAITIDDNVAITIPEGTTLTIKDESENGEGSIEILDTDNNDTNNNGVFVNNGTINLEGGNLDEGVINNTANGNVTITNDNIDNDVVTGNTGNVTNYAKGLKEAFTNGGEYTLGADVTLNESLTLAAGKTLALNLNGNTIFGKTFGNTNPQDMMLIKGNLTVENGTIIAEHVGENMGWGGQGTIFDITAGGVVNLNTVTAKYLGGTDMNFVAHLNNWGEATFNAENCTLEATYIAVRAFNSGYDMNNVTIKNSTLKGKYCFWVHNYKEAGDNSGTDATLNINIFDQGNTFEYTGKAPILYGFNEPLYFDAEGKLLAFNIEDLKKFIGKDNQRSEVALANNIELNEQLNIAKEFTLDLNGKTITGTDTITGSFGLITNKGNLTVKNGTITLVATNNRGWNAYSSVISNNPGGNLVVENVTIEHLGGTDMAYGIDNLTNGKGTSAVATINEGAIVKSPYRAVRMFLNGIEANNSLTVNAGAVIEGNNKSIWMQDPSKNANTGKLVVTADAKLKGDAYLSVTAGSTEWPVEVSIADDAFEGESTLLSNNVPAGYEVVLENDVWTVVAYEKIAEGLYKNGVKYLVMNADGLAELNTMMANKTAGMNVKVVLGNDIDFNGKTWTPVDSHADSSFYLNEFDGNSHTISNLTINGQAMFTRFAGFGDVTIKNVTFDNANVNSNGNINTSILTVQSYQNVLLDNVDVKNSTIIGGYKVAPLIGTVYNESSSTITATLKNCDVEDTTVKAVTYDYGTTGMVAFVFEGDNDKIVFDNCSIKNVSLYAPNTYGYELHAAIYMNDKDTDDLINETEGVNVDNVTFTLIQ